MPEFGRESIRAGVNEVDWRYHKAASGLDDLTCELTHALRLDPETERSYKIDYGNTPLIGRALRP